MTGYGGAIGSNPYAGAGYPTGYNGPGYPTGSGYPTGYNGTGYPTGYNGAGYPTGYNGAGYPTGYNGYPTGGYPAYGGMPFTTPTFDGSLPDAAVGQGLFGEVDGYGVDLNNNGVYDAGQDGVLAFDMNGDGRIDDAEIEGSNDRLKAFGGNFDLNADGSVTPCEKFQGQMMQSQMQGVDFNHDGRLEGYEVSMAGGRMCVDQNRDGHSQPWEQYSPFQFPTPGFGMGSLGYVDPFGGFSGVLDTQWMW